MVPIAPWAPPPHTDRGETTRPLEPLFAELRKGLVNLLERIVASPNQPDRSVLHGHFPVVEQERLARSVVEQLGYDFECGRLDRAVHPFTTGFGSHDIRITTRYEPHWLPGALFGTVHETGHALYEQGIGHDLVPPLGRAVSPGVHESQSRLWENIVSRSRGFWQFAYPELQQRFPDQLGGVPLDVFYRAINKVSRSLIRTDADEVTYNLHVMIRFDLECEMLEGRLAIADLADAWNARYRSDLGIEPSDHRDGVLQDVHWYAGGLGGAFQGYTIGNILAAQFHAAAIAANPSVADEIVRGEFRPLHAWLRTSIYAHGRRYDVAQLVERVTGGPMRIEPYMRYLEAKYADLYGIAVH
jgi:carboxypeptidase Taq